MLWESKTLFFIDRKMNEQLPLFTRYDRSFKLIDTISEGHVSRLQTVEADGQKFVLKRYPLWFNKSDVQFIHDLTQFLENEGVNTPGLIQTTDGDTFVPVNGELYAIYKHIDATKVGEDDETIEALGSLLGRVHRASSSYTPRTPRRWWIIGTYKAGEYFGEAESLILSSGREELKPKLNLLNAGYGEVKRLLLNSGQYGQMSRLVIHGDFDNRNTMNTGGQIYVVDFDNAREEIREMDFVDPLRYICKVPEEGWIGRVDKFLSGYKKSSGMSDLNPEAILASLYVCCVQEGLWQLRESAKTRNSDEHKRAMNAELEFLSVAMSNSNEIVQGLTTIIEK